MSSSSPPSAAPTDPPAQPTAVTPAGSGPPRTLRRRDSRLVRRRTLDMVLLAGAVLLVGVAAGAGALAAGGTERATALWAGAELSADGTAAVTEVIAWDFGTNQRHGIFRDVPGLLPDAAVSASSATAPDQVELIDMGFTTRIRVGDPARTVHGAHRYRVQYPLDDMVRNGQLAWDVIGAGWEVTIHDIEVHVAAPYELVDFRCVATDGGGGECRIAQPEPGHLVASVDQMPAGGTIMLYATAGRILDGAPDLQPPSTGRPPGGAPLAYVWLLAAATALVAAALAARGIRRAGRERISAGTSASFGEPGAGPELRVDPARLASLAAVAAGPPPELTPAQGGVLYADAVRKEHKVAWLIDAVAHGLVDVERRDGHVVLLAGRAPTDRSEESARAYSLLRGAFHRRAQLTLGSYDARFADVWRAVGDLLDAWRGKSGLWDPAGERRCRRSRQLGVAAAAVGAAAVVVGGYLSHTPGLPWQPVVLAGALVAGTGAAALIGAWELRVRTPLGSRLWLQVEGFRRFLVESGSPHRDAAADTRKLLEYTAWAVALDETDRWCDSAEGSGLSREQLVGMRYLSIAQALPFAIAAACKAPSSSSGSTHVFRGGGGGGSGGGSGGGGGSW